MRDLVDILEERERTWSRGRDIDYELEGRLPEEGFDEDDRAEPLFDDDFA